MKESMKQETECLKITHSEQQRENRLKNINQRLRDLWQYDKRANNHAIRDPKEEKKNNRAGKVLEEIMAGVE